MTLRVTITDLDTGDTQEALVGEGDYAIACHDPCKVARVRHYGGGKAVLTITGHDPQPIAVPPADIRSTPPTGASVTSRKRAASKPRSSKPRRAKDATDAG